MSWTLHDSSLFHSGDQTRKRQPQCLVPASFIRESLHTPGSCVSVIYSEQSQNGSPTFGQKADAPQLTPQADIRFLFLNGIKEFKSNMISLPKFSILTAVLEMWALREVLPVPFLSFSLSLMWRTKFLNVNIGGSTIQSVFL